MMNRIHQFLLLGLLLLASGQALAGVVTFDQWSEGGQYGDTNGGAPGQLFLTEDGIDCYTAEFDPGTGGLIFGEAFVRDPYLGFGDGQILRFQNISMRFVMPTPGPVKFEFSNRGGRDNLIVNGGPPLVIDDWAALDGREVAPGVTLSLSGTGDLGDVYLDGPVHGVTIGGAELFIDNVYALSTESPDWSGEVSADCHVFVGYEGLDPGREWTGPAEGVHVENGVVVSVLQLDTDDGELFDRAEVAAAEGAGRGNVMRLSKCIQVLDLSAGGMVAGTSSWVFRDRGELLFLMVNRDRPFLGPVEDLPGEISEDVFVEVEYSRTPVGVVGRITLTGPVQEIAFGGLLVDADSHCFEIIDGDIPGGCSLVQDFESLNPSDAWHIANTAPGDAIFTEDGITWSLDTLGNGFFRTDVEFATAEFGDGLVLHVQNMDLVMDLGSHEAVRLIRIPYRVGPGTGDLVVNGLDVAGGRMNTIPVGPFANGVEVLSNDYETFVNGEAHGEIVLLGDIQTLAMGGTSLRVDNICITFESLATGVEDHALPAALDLAPAYPNPFNPSTTLSFRLERGARTTLTVHDAAGRLVRTLLDAELSAGEHRVLWDGDDDRGAPAAAGVYFARAAAADGIQVRKLALIK